MAGVYGDIDQLVDEEGQQTPDTGFYQKVERIKSEIDSNMNIIANFVDTLRIQDHAQYAEYKQEYEAIRESYNVAIEEAMVTGQTRADSVTQQQMMDNLFTTLEYAKASVQNIMGTGWAPVGDVSIASQGIPPQMGGNGVTAMVKHSDVPTNGDIINMQRVGQVRSWWEGLHPGLRVVVGALAIGGAIYGGKKAWDWASDKWGDSGGGK